MENLSNDNYEENSLKIKNLVNIIENKKCGECKNELSVFVNETIGNYTCYKCAEILYNKIYLIKFNRRSLNQPHKLKLISMSNFTNQTVQFMSIHGNFVF